ncbi:MAG: DUF2157 domain-containing protein [bacterium]|nr:DUF2157 domain-containing protein [bacterium]
MPNNTSFLKILQTETKRWISEGIISSEQKDKILELYPAEAAAGSEKKKKNVHLPAIIIGMAAVLLCVGIILFYAANWKNMPPVVKIVQVFILLFSTYGAAYYFLAVNEGHRALGRAFLMIGMVAFGAGITLTAQIFHISAHPTNGVLAWALGVLIMSWVARERWGYYLAMVLLFVWNSWEFAQYGNPNYIFILFIIVLFATFYNSKDKVGSVFMFFMFMLWFYQVNGYWFNKEIFGTDFEVAGPVFAFLHIPFGVVLVGLGMLGDKNKTLEATCKIMRVFGWIFIFGPLVGFSWPLDLETNYLTFNKESIPFTIEYIVLIAMAGGTLILLAKKNIKIVLLAAITAFSLVMLVLPMGHKSTLMITTHLGLLALMFGMLYSSYITAEDNEIERVMGFVFFVMLISLKGVGFFSMGIASASGNFYIAYCLGFIIFATVCFLINQVLGILVGREEKEFPVIIINAVCAIMGFLIIYALSFKLENQNSVFNAQAIVLVMLFLFLFMALGLYLYLWTISPEKLILSLSAIVFFCSAFVLFISGPSISWVIYSLIFNILLFVFIGVLIYYSTRVNSKALANLAIAAFMIHITTRYFDVFWDLLSGAALFLITGALGLAGGWLLEKNRRKLLQRIADSEQHITKGSE